MSVLRAENSLPVRPGFKSIEYYRKQHKPEKDRTVSLSADHGEAWKRFRSKVNPVLLQPKTIELYTAAIDEIAVDMIKRMKSLRNEQNQIESKFDVEMNLWALESIGVVALGGRLNCFDPNLAEDSPARELIRNTQDLFTIINTLDFKAPLWKYYPTKHFRLAMKLFEEQEMLTKYFIDKAKREILVNTNNSDDEKGVLEKLLAIDEKVANVIASDTLFAGIDTTSNTITATLYLLAVNPDKQIKLREEIRLKEKKSYLKACIKESMRMMPVAKGNARETTRSYNVLGYDVPKGTCVIFCHQFMSSHESNFMKPQEFIPERWLAEKNDPMFYGNGHRFAFSPFGFGVRTCIGRRIAELEIETFLSRLIENFDVGWFGGPPQVTSTTINYITGPFNFVFKDV